MVWTVKCEALENAKIAMDDQIEEVYAINRELLNINEKHLKNNNEFNDAIDLAKKETKNKNCKPPRSLGNI